MISLIRLLFVIFLVLLQLVAPLIHAHKNNKANHYNSSFHLPEFEQLNTLLDKKVVMIAPRFHEGEIITVSSGIRETKQKWIYLDNNTVVLAIVCFWFCVLTKELVFRFAIKTEPIKRRRFLNLAFLRAPPFFFI